MVLGAWDVHGWIVKWMDGAWGSEVAAYLILEVFSPGRHACDGGWLMRERCRYLK